MSVLTWPQAEVYARQAICLEPGCERKRPIIRLLPGGYIVVCPTHLAHSLAQASSLFGAMLKRWRAGEIIFGLEGEIFAKTLRSLARKDPERWNYAEDDNGRVIRIGKEWAPDYYTRGGG